MSNLKKLFNIKVQDNKISVTPSKNLESILKHYRAVPILIEAVKNLPNATEVLADWDSARS